MELKMLVAQRNLVKQINPREKFTTLLKKKIKL